MPHSLQNPLSLLGRALIALLFIPSGFGKLIGFSATGWLIGRYLDRYGARAPLAVASNLGRYGGSNMTSASDAP